MATKYGAIVTSTATLSLTAGAANPDYPLSNLASGTRPDLVFKATAGTCTIRATFGGATTVQAVGIVNHNRPSTNVTLTSSGGMNTTMALPANTEDGQCAKGWKDLTSVSGSTGITTLDFAIAAGSGNAAIGGLAIVTSLATMDITWGVTHSDVHPVIEHRTEYDVSLIYDLGLRYRTFTANVIRESERAAITTLNRTCKGRVTPFLFVLDDSVNDWALVRFKTIVLPWELAQPRQSNASIELEEVSAGLAL
jgi:hypothetical protein